METVSLVKKQYWEVDELRQFYVIMSLFVLVDDAGTAAGHCRYS